MSKRRDFKFDGGGILRRISAWWLVSYMYYLEIDKTHKNWQQNLSEKLIKFRKDNFNKSESYHKLWLEEISEMKHLDKHPNLGKLSGCEIKNMANQLLKQWEKWSIS